VSIVPRSSTLLGVSVVRPESLTGSLELVATPPRHSASLLSGLVLVVVVGLGTLPRGHFLVAVYAVSFWHYYLYALAYGLGAVPLGVLKRDAIAMKAVSLTALAAAYLAAPIDGRSVAVVGGGFLLNALGARALGADRTYYGHEVAGLPQWRSKAFPYSWISHPMLVGNIAAFGGTLINADFRREWWPLAGAHVAMNGGLLVMELSVTPRRRERLRAWAGQVGAAALRAPLRSGLYVAGSGAALGVAAGFAASSPTDVLLGAAIGAGVAAHAAVIAISYSMPAVPRAAQGGARRHDLPC